MEEPEATCLNADTTNRGRKLISRISTVKLDEDEETAEVAPSMLNAWRPAPIQPLKIPAETNRGRKTAASRRKPRPTPRPKQTTADRGKTRRRSPDKRGRKRREGFDENRSPPPPQSIRPRLRGPVDVEIHASAMNAAIKSDKASCTALGARANPGQPLEMGGPKFFTLK